MLTREKYQCQCKNRTFKRITSPVSQPVIWVLLTLTFGVTPSRFERCCGLSKTDGSYLQIINAFHEIGVLMPRNENELLTCKELNDSPYDLTLLSQCTSFGHRVFPSSTNVGTTLS